MSKTMNFREDVLKHATDASIQVELALLRIFVITSFTNTVRHSVNDSTSKGLVISLFSEFRSCIASEFKHVLSCNSCCNTIRLYLKKV